MNQSKVDAKLVRDGRRTVERRFQVSHHSKYNRIGYGDTPLSTTCIWADNDAILPPRDHALDIRDHQGLRIEIINGEIKEALNLAGMQVHGDDMVAASNCKHIGDKLSGDGGAGLVLLVHPGIGEAGYDGGDASCGGAFAGGDEDEELHEVIVHVTAAGLDDEDILFSDGL